MKWIKAYVFFSILVLLGLSWFVFEQYQRAEIYKLELGAVSAKQRGNANISKTVAESSNQEPGPRETNVADQYIPANQPTEFDLSKIDPAIVDRVRKEVMNKPIYRRAYEVKRNSDVIGIYDNYLKQVDFGEVNRSELLALLGERRFVARDVTLAARDTGVYDQESIKQLINETSSEIESELRQLVGDTGFENLVYYEKTAGQRELIETLEYRLSLSATPLNSAQSKALYDVLTRENTADAGFNIPRTVWRATSDHVVEAQAVLSSIQIESLKLILEEENLDSIFNEARNEINKQLRSEWEAGSGG